MGNLSIAQIPPATVRHNGGSLLVPSATFSQTMQPLQLPFSVLPMICASQIAPAPAYMLEGNNLSHMAIAPGNYSVIASQPGHSNTLMPVPSGYAPTRLIQSFNRIDSRRQNAMRVTRSPFYTSAGHHNHVDVTRIREGIDVRTTVGTILHLHCPPCVGNC